MSMDRKERELISDDRRVSFSLPRSKKRDNRSDTVDRKREEEETQITEEGEDDLESVSRRDSLNSDVPSITMRHKKKWKIKLPWKNNKKRRAYSQPTVESPVREESFVYEKRSSSLSNEIHSDSGKENEDGAKSPQPKQDMKLRSFSWVGESHLLDRPQEEDTSKSFTNISESINVEVMEVIPSSSSDSKFPSSKSKSQSYQHFSSIDSSSNDDVRLRKKKKNKKAKTRYSGKSSIWDNFSQSQPNLIEPDAKTKERNEMKLGRQFSESEFIENLNFIEVDEPQVNQKTSIEEPPIKKSNSLPSIFFKKKKKKKIAESSASKKNALNKSLPEDNLNVKENSPRGTPDKVSTPETMKSCLKQEPIHNSSPKSPSIDREVAKQSSREPQKPKRSKKSSGKKHRHRHHHHHHHHRHHSPPEAPEEKVQVSEAEPAQKELGMSTFGKNKSLSLSEDYLGSKLNQTSGLEDKDNTNTESNRNTVAPLASYNQVYKESSRYDVSTMIKQASLVDSHYKKTYPKESSNTFPKASELRARRRSYEEMINLIEEEMFNWSDDDSSDTDGDQVDLSFNKLVDEDGPEGMRNKPNFKLRSVHNSDLSLTETELVFEPKIGVKKTGSSIPTQNVEAKKSPPLKRPPGAPPPPPKSIETIREEEKESGKTVQDYTFRTKQLAHTEERTKKKKFKKTIKIRNNLSSSSSSSLDDIREPIYINASYRGNFGDGHKLKEIQSQTLTVKEKRKIEDFDQSLSDSESPPSFSPPPIPGTIEGKDKIQISPSSNDNAEQMQDKENIPLNLINNDRKPNSATRIARSLFTQKGENRSSSNYDDKYLINLPIKNIQTATVKPNPPPPPPPPPIDDDPFSIATTAATTTTNSFVFHNAGGVKPKYAYSSNAYSTDSIPITASLPSSYASLNLNKGYGERLGDADRIISSKQSYEHKKSTEKFDLKSNTSKDLSSSSTVFTRQQPTQEDMAPNKLLSPSFTTLQKNEDKEILPTERTIDRGDTKPNYTSHTLPLQSVLAKTQKKQIVTFHLPSNKDDSRSPSDFTITYKSLPQDQQAYHPLENDQETQKHESKLPSDINIGYKSFSNEEQDYQYLQHLEERKAVDKLPSDLTLGYTSLPQEKQTYHRLQQIQEERKPEQKSSLDLDKTYKSLSSEQQTFPLKSVQEESLSEYKPSLKLTKPYNPLHYEQQTYQPSKQVQEEREPENKPPLDVTKAYKSLPIDHQTYHHFQQIREERNTENKPSLVRTKAYSSLPNKHQTYQNFQQVKEERGSDYKPLNITKTYTSLPNEHQTHQHLQHVQEEKYSEKKPPLDFTTAYKSQPNTQQTYHHLQQVQEERKPEHKFTSDFTVNYETLPVEQQTYHHFEQVQEESKSAYHSFHKGSDHSLYDAFQHDEMPKSSSLVKHQVMSMQQEAMKMSYKEKTATNYDLSSAYHKETVDVFPQPQTYKRDFEPQPVRASMGYIKTNTPIPYVKRQAPLKSILRNSNKPPESRPDVGQTNMVYSYHENREAKLSSTQTFSSMASADAITHSVYNTVERVEVSDETSSSDDDTPPALPQYPPPPPRPYSSLQQDFFEDLLRPTSSQASVKFSKPSYLSSQSSNYIPTIIEVSADSDEQSSIYQNVIHASQV